MIASSVSLGLSHPLLSLLTLSLSLWIHSTTQFLLGSPSLLKHPVLAQSTLHSAKLVSVFLSLPQARSLSTLVPLQSSLLSPFLLPHSGTFSKPPFFLTHKHLISSSRYSSQMALRSTVLNNFKEDSSPPL